MECVKVAADLLKSAMWPAVVVFLALYFRDEMRRLFGRIIKAGPTGVEFDAQKQIAKWSGELK